MDTEAGTPGLLRRIEELAQHAAADDQQQPLDGPLLAAAITGLRAELGDLRADVGDLRQTVSAGLTKARGAGEERLAALEDALDGLAERLEAVTRDTQSSSSEQLDRVEQKVDALSARVLEEAVAAQGEWAEQVRAALGDVAAAVDRSLGSLGVSLTDAVRVSREVEQPHLDGVAATLSDLRSTLDSLESANGATRRLVEEEVAALRRDLADALEEVRDRITATVDRADMAITEVVSEQRRAFDESLRDLRASVSSAAKAGEVTTEAIDVVAKAGHAAVDEFRAEVRSVVADLRTSVETGTQEVAGSKDLVMSATERLVTAGQALLAYLARRDEVLEHERDRVLHEVLDEFAQGLSAKERRGMGERVGTALERRRDARDAQRYRRTATGKPAFDAPEPPPADLAALNDPLPEPKRAKPSRPKTSGAKAPGAAATARKTAQKSGQQTGGKTAAKPAAKTAGTAAAGRSATGTRTVKRAPKPPAAAAVPPEPEESSAANTTQPLDGEGTTRV